MAEKSLNDRLEAIHESMQGMLVKTEEREAKFFAPISEEQLKLSKPTSSGRTVFTLGERMEEFDKIVRRHREGLEKLWNEWADIQTELVALAVEVFGPQSIQIQDDATPKLDRAVQSATLKHERNMEAALGPLNELKALKQSVQQATQQTIETSEQIEQVRSCWRVYRYLLTPEMAGLERGFYKGARDYQTCNEEARRLM